MTYKFDICPWCDNDANLRISNYTPFKGFPDIEWVCVRCKGCDCFGPPADTEEKAIEKWNDRQS